MTQKEVLEQILKELATIKSGMPNGELKRMEEGMKEMKKDISDIKKTLLDPNDGVIVSNNKNTEFREDAEDVVNQVNNLKEWKSGVTKALWVLYGTLIGVIIKFITDGWK